MFKNLTDRLNQTLKTITGQARLTDDNIKATLREVRMALLEADVALSVVKTFIERVRERAVGTEVSQALNPGQQFIKIVHAELVHVMGEANESLNLASQPPAVILMAGLQGAGKTTATAKLARFLIERENKKVMVVSADVYRPAAILQLKTLGDDVGAMVFPSSADQKPVAIALAALDAARKQFADVLIVDTAGRLAIDEEMMAEIQLLHHSVHPVETLFVVDAMTGQDAAKTALVFSEALPLTGVILSKTDGDARGGAALSVRQITGKPIKFLGVGEKTDALEAFHPDRLASRILDMGDMLSLIEEVERKVDKEKAEKLATKLKKGKGFDLQDFRDQLTQMNSLGGLGGLMEKMPGMNQMGAAGMTGKMAGAENHMSQMGVVIDSMTPLERAFPDKINGSRKRRIAVGSGTQIQDVNRVLKQHKQMQKMMKKVGAKGGMAKMMRGMKGMSSGGGFPGGRPPGM